MSAILERLRAAHDARRHVRVVVPEYGDLEMHFAPLTVVAKTAINRGVAPNDEAGLMVNALVVLAHDANGEKLFQSTPETKAELHRMDLIVLRRIMQEAGGQPDIGAAEAELAALDADELRAALGAGVAASPGLAEVLSKASDDDLRSMLGDLARAQAAALPVKNG